MPAKGTAAAYLCGKLQPGKGAPHGVSAHWVGVMVPIRQAPKAARLALRWLCARRCRLRLARRTLKDKASVPARQLQLCTCRQHLQHLKVPLKVGPAEEREVDRSDTKWEYLPSSPIMDDQVIKMVPANALTSQLPPPERCL